LVNVKVDQKGSLQYPQINGKILTGTLIIYNEGVTGKPFLNLAPFVVDTLFAVCNEIVHLGCVRTYIPVMLVT